MYPVHTESILLLRKNLRSISEYVLPEGFTIRFYNDRDADHWVAIQNFAFQQNTFNAERFCREFQRDLEQLKTRMLFLCNPIGRVIGTSTSWHEDQETGLVHWMAIIPEYQGRGMSKPLLSATLKQMKALGYTRSILRTKPFLIAAINLYLGFGFKPCIQSERERERWEQVIEQFKQRNLNCDAIISAMSATESEEGRCTR